MSKIIVSIRNFYVTGFYLGIVHKRNVLVHGSDVVKLPKIFYVVMIVVFHNVKIRQWF